MTPPPPRCAGTLLWSALEDRALQIHWPPGEAVYASPHLNTTYTGPVAAVRPGFARQHGAAQRTELAAWERKCLFALRAALRAGGGGFSRRFDHPVEVLEHNCGLARWIYGHDMPEELRPPAWVPAKLRRLGLPDWRSAFGCALNLLFQMRPDHVQQVAPLANVLTSNHSLSICIHFRAGDQYLQNRTRAAEELERVLQAAEPYFACAAEVECRHLGPGQQPVW